MAEFTHPDPQGPLLGFGLFTHGVDVDALAAALEDEIQGGVTRHTSGGGETGRPEGPMLAVDAQGVTILVAPVGVPVPDDQALSACHPLWWPDTSEVASHTSHVVLTAYREPGSTVDRERALHEAVMFSVVATIVLEQPGAVGLFYGSAGVTIPEAAYRDLVINSLDEGRLPVEGWVSAWLLQGEDDSITGYTLGLDTFGHADLLVEDSRREASEVYALLMSLATHVVTTGEHLLPGMTIGLGPDEQHSVTARESDAHNGLVLQIAY